MAQIVEASKVLKTVKSFPEILRQGSNDQQDENYLRGYLQGIFMKNANNIFEIHGQAPDAYASQSVKIYQAIRRLGKPLQNITLDDITKLINRISKENEDEGKRDRAGYEADQKERDDARAKYGDDLW
jgi:hypothetical protein